VGRLDAHTRSSADGETRVYLDITANEVLVLDRPARTPDGLSGDESAEAPLEEVDDDLPF
jgi:hypothetical protein